MHSECQGAVLSCGQERHSPGCTGRPWSGSALRSLKTQEQAPSQGSFVKEFGLFILEKKRLCKDMVSISEQAHGGLEATIQTDLEGRRFLTERKI